MSSIDGVGGVPPEDEPPDTPGAPEPWGSGSAVPAPVPDLAASPAARARAAQSARADRFRAASDARAAERAENLWLASLQVQRLDAALVESTRAGLRRYDGFTRMLLIAAGRRDLSVEPSGCPSALSVEDLDAADHLLAETEVATALVAWTEMSLRQVEREVSDALTLQGSLPRMLRSCWDGHLLEQHLEVVLRATTGLETEQLTRLDEFATSLADNSLKSFRRQVRAYAAQLRQETQPDVAQTISEQRTVSVRACPDGSASLWVNGPAPEIHALYTRLNACARQIRRDASGGGASAGDGDFVGADDAVDDAVEGGGVVRDPRTLAQLRFDLLTSALVDGRNPEHLPAQARVAVTVPLLTALGAADLPGELDGFGPLDAETARDLAGSVVTWTRILTDPIDGQILPASAQYRVPAGLRDHVRARNRWCTAPGCTRRATDCETDHIIPFDHEQPARGGRTETTNLHPLCTAHHQAKTEGRLQVRRTIDETGHPVLRWTLPGTNSPFDVLDDTDTANAEQVRILVAYQRQRSGSQASPASPAPQAAEPVPPGPGAPPF